MGRIQRGDERSHLAHLALRMHARDEAATSARVLEAVAVHTDGRCYSGMAQEAQRTTEMHRCMGWVKVSSPGAARSHVAMHIVRDAVHGLDGR